MNYTNFYATFAQKSGFDANLLLLACLSLQKDLQTVDAGDADIPDSTDFAGAEELDRSRTGIEIELEGDDGRIIEKAAVRLKDDQIDRVGPEHHSLCCG